MLILATSAIVDNFRTMAPLPPMLLEHVVVDVAGEVEGDVDVGVATSVEIIVVDIQSGHNAAMELARESEPETRGI